MAMLALWTVGTGQMIIVLLVGLLIFGKKLPDLARNLGKSMVEFRKGLNGGDNNFKIEGQDSLNGKTMNGKE
ncbi:MAG: twin-arginine translocase TatA/TatE family subunit [Sedimentisphaerales bacterium]|nr:twin-arginine translocase TatA/TatE family subunit [Sedimentisphaerales bacterium]MBN2843303.1 twin-arginine translocase TatA/TatE family subunit [Sedimentisphaerales bacterium]